MTSEDHILQLVTQRVNKYREILAATTDQRMKEITQAYLLEAEAIQRIIKKHINGGMTNERHIDRT